SRRRHTISKRDWSSDVCSSDLVKEIKSNQVEITVSWFSILNSFFIIVFSSMFSKWWESKYNPSAAVKYGLGLILMGVGFAIMARSEERRVGKEIILKR